MAWEDDMGVILRVMLNDTAGTTYTDARLEQTLVVAARLVLQEVTFTQTYDVDVNDIAISPDPTNAATRDDAFVNLVCLKSACIVERGETRTAAGQGIMIRDGSSVIDLRSVLGGRLTLLEKGWCGVYAEAKKEYLVGQTGYVAGSAIMTPYRFYEAYTGDGGYSTVREMGRSPYLF